MNPIPRQLISYTYWGRLYMAPLSAEIGWTILDPEYFNILINHNYLKSLEEYRRTGGCF